MARINEKAASIAANADLTDGQPATHLHLLHRTSGYTLVMYCGEVGRMSERSAPYIDTRHAWRGFEVEHRCPACEVALVRSGGAP